MSRATRQRTGRGGAITLALAVLASLWIALVNTGTLQTDDTEVRVRMAHAWWSGEAELPPPISGPRESNDSLLGVLTPSGKRVGYYEPGQSLLILPADWLASKLLAARKHYPAESPRFKSLKILMISWLVFVPLNVASVLACFWLLTLLGFRESLAGLASIALLIGTTLLGYAQVPHQNNQVLLFATLSYCGVLAWTRSQRRRYLFLSGAAAGAALLVRATSLIHVFTVGVFLLGCLLSRTRDRRQLATDLTIWTGSFVPFALIDRWFDYIRYGSFWTTGQRLWTQQLNSDPLFAALPRVPANYPFTNDPHVGILGVLFSPAKSIFIYDPLLLPCLVVAVALWRQFSAEMRWYVGTTLLNLMLFVLMTSQLEFWHGDWAWAARYHVTSVQLLMIPLVAHIVQRARDSGWFIAWPLRIALLVAILVQSLSVALPPNLEILEEDLARTPACTDSSRLPLGFRLGNRVVNIVCLMDASVSQQCPAAVAARTKAAPGSACADDLRELEGRKRTALLAFSGARLGWHPALLIASWSAALMIAIAWTVLWFRSLAPEPAPREGSSSPATLPA